MSDKSGIEINNQPSEYIDKPPTPKYLPDDFIDKAQIGNIDELKSWLGENLGTDVKKEVVNRQDFWPKDFREKNPFMADAADGMAKREVSFVFGILYNYANQMHRVLSYDPERARQRAAEFKKKVVTLQDVQQRKIGMEMIIDELGLGGEKRVIDYLYQKASGTQVVDKS